MVRLSRVLSPWTGCSQHPPATPIRVTAKHRVRSFIVAGQAIRAAANANPNHRCWRCGNTLATCGPHGNGTNANGTPATWDCGHTNHGTLEAECSPCNRKHGAIDGNRNREPHSGWI